MSTVVKVCVFTGLLIVAAALLSPTVTLAETEPVKAPTSQLYNKPYLLGEVSGVSLGGYMDMEFEYNEDGSNTFDQHRFIPFITGHVSDRVTVSTEIEFEHGGKVDGSDGDGEIKLEYAVMDFRLNESLSFRGGVILSPLGSFNVLHDSPLNDLTARPVVTRQLIPTTLSESGMGVFGSLYPNEDIELSYELYLVNGFNDEIISGDPGSEQLRIRQGRGSAKADNNQNKAFVGHLGLSPAMGVNFGVSLHTGTYDSADNHQLTIAAVDGKVVFGALELQAEVAMANANIDRQAYAAVAENQRGLYAQVNYHLLHDTLLSGSVVTLVVRGDWMDYDSDNDGDSEHGLTVGANFRPTEETVFKLDYNWAWETPLRGEKGDAEGRFFLSMATYF